MKRGEAVAITALAIVISGSAFAADLPAKMAVKAPPERAIYDWTGFYIGGHVGHGWARPEIDVPGSGPITNQPHPEGVLGGGQIGFNWQTASWVFGLEADGSWGDLDDTRTCLLANGLTVSCRGAPEWFGTIAGRAGYAIDHALWYVKGGAAWVHEDFSHLAGTIPTCLTLCTGSNFVWGWTIGGGLEYAFDPNWSAKVEYNYMDFSDKDRVIVSNGVSSDTFDVGKIIHTVKVGLNYKFGPSVIAARY